MPLSKHNLDSMTEHGCDLPGCTNADHETVFLHARCHIGGKLEVSYRNGSGVLRIACRQCGKVVALVAVKEE